MGDSAADNLRRIMAKIAEAERFCTRPSGSVRLIAVSKTFDEAAIEPFLRAGQRIFGENRVQEAAGKWPQLRTAFTDIELHLIGPLQTNKVREALALFDVIQTVDRDRLAGEIAKEMAKTPRRPALYVQVNTGEEPQKAGIPPHEAPSFLARCRDVHGLSISGLMCIPPATQPPGPHFALLTRMADEAGLAVRSMGMSGDYEQAIWCGATHVRVGSALFGSRAPVSQS